MNRKLLFLGTTLGLLATLAGIGLVFMINHEDINRILVAIIGLNINLFHALLLLILAWIKRKYQDQNLVAAGGALFAGVLVFSLPAYLWGISEGGAMIFNTVGMAGVPILLIGWGLMIKEFVTGFMKK
jgi:hypothetical protein